jgi:hypothetical protein
VEKTKSKRKLREKTSFGVERERERSNCDEERRYRGKTCQGIH